MYCVIKCTTVNGPWLSVNACKATLFQQRLHQTLGGGSDKNPKHGCTGGIFGLVPWLQVLATPHVKDGILGIQSFTVVPMGARTVGLLTEAQQWQVMYYVPHGRLDERFPGSFSFVTEDNQLHCSNLYPCEQ